MKGVISTGIQCPIIREGDDLAEIIVRSVIQNIDLHDNDIIGVTESVVARAAGLYATVNDIAEETVSLFGRNAKILLINPIYSRNRFSVILRGIARGADEIIIHMPRRDEVGNPNKVNPWTGVNIQDYYKSICKEEECKCTILSMESAEYFLSLLAKSKKYSNVLNCMLHGNYDFSKYNYENVKSLKDYFSDITEYGLLGSNKATDELVKLFPSEKLSLELVNTIKNEIFNRVGKKVEVMIYGDGCFKDPDVGIWEFADPVTSPAYTSGLNGCPHEIKIKAFADDKYKGLYGEELDEAIRKEIKNKTEDTAIKMDSQGTTPRRYVNLLASLMDLTSGSGDKGTPVVVVQNYFKNYSNA